MNVNESFQILSVWVENIDFCNGPFACFPMEGLFGGPLPECMKEAMLHDTSTPDFY